jgi:hypothetical protein
VLSVTLKRAVSGCVRDVIARGLNWICETISRFGSETASIERDPLSLFSDPVSPRV